MIGQIFIGWIIQVSTRAAVNLGRIDRRYAWCLRFGRSASSGRHRWRSRRLGCLGRSSPLRGRPRLRFGFTASGGLRAGFSRASIAVASRDMCPTKWSPMVRRTSASCNWPGSEPSARQTPGKRSLRSEPRAPNASRKAAGACCRLPDARSSPASSAANIERKARASATQPDTTPLNHLPGGSSTVTPNSNQTQEGVSSYPFR